MKAIVTHLRQDKKREKFLVEDWPEPGPMNPTSFATKTLYTGVTNGTERNDLIGGNYANPDDKLPAGWGYQNVGEVTAVGGEVNDIKVGDRVYLSADHVEHTVFDTEWKLYVKLPEAVDSKDAALFGMAAVALRSCLHADIRIGEKVLIVGAGFIGQTAAQVADAMGASVTIVDINEERLEMARSIGAAEKVCNTSGDGWEKNIEKFAYDVVIDVAGVPGMETQMIEALVSRGRIMFIAGRFRVDYDFNIAQGHEVHIFQNSHFNKDELELLAHLVARGKIKIAPFVRDVLSPKEAKGVYDTLRDEPEKLSGVVFDWSQV